MCSVNIIKTYPDEFFISLTVMQIKEIYVVDIPKSLLI
jgi:hypothetical protein